MLPPPCNPIFSVKTRSSVNNSQYGVLSDVVDSADRRQGEELVDGGRLVIGREGRRPDIRSTTILGMFDFGTYYSTPTPDKRSHTTPLLWFVHVGNAGYIVHSGTQPNSSPSISIYGSGGTTRITRCSQYSRPSPLLPFP